MGAKNVQNLAWFQTTLDFVIIFGTDQDINSLKTLLSTAIHFTFDGEDLLTLVY